MSSWHVLAIFVQQKVEILDVVTEGTAMTRHNAFDSWTHQVVSAFPCLSRPQATVLALYSFGAILADRCGLSSVAIMLFRVLGVPYLTIRSRLQEFYQPASAKSGTRRRDFDVTICFAPLITWALKGWQSNHLALALDATSLGDRFTVLSLSILYRGSACPVAWKIMQANVRHAWKPEWIALLQLVQPLIPAGWTVLVMTDRGLYARWLFQQIVALGWHPLMRITSKSTFRKNGSRATVPVVAICSKARPTVERTRRRISEESAQPARLHAFRLLGVRSRGTLVHCDRPGTGPERRLVVCDASLDRTRVQAAQKPRLAMAEEPDDGPRPRQSVVAGTGRRHPLRAGRRWGSRRIRHRRPDGASATLRVWNHSHRQASR